MKPKHIHVFDGLRITTEHIEHLQGGYYSAVEDFREILGLGSVHYGFEVQKAGDRAVTIQPGLAFDRQKNRIVCDEPKTLEVEFHPNDDSKYVCVEYKQIQDGEVEGRFTLIWDSCSVTLRGATPGPEDSLIPLAKLVKRPIKEGESFEIVSLIAPVKGSHPESVRDPETMEPPEADEEGDEGIDEISTEIGPSAAESEGGAEPAYIPPEVESTSGPGEPGSATEETQRSSYDEDRTPVSESESNIEAQKQGAWKLRVQQGIVRLGSNGPEGKPLSAIILEALKKRVRGDGHGNTVQVGFSLADKEVSLDFPMVNLTCHTITTMTFDSSERTAFRRDTGTETSAPDFRRLRFRSTSHGEVTIVNGTASQFGLSTLQFIPSSNEGRAPGWNSDLTEIGVAHLPVSLVLGPLADDSLKSIVDIIRNLQIVVEIDRTGDVGFRAICNLAWKGGINEEIIQGIENRNIGVNWSVHLAWKALGHQEISA